LACLLPLSWKKLLLQMATTKKKAAYVEIVTSIFDSKNTADIKPFVDHIAKSNNQIVSRQVLLQFAQIFKEKQKKKEGKIWLKSIEEAETIILANNSKVFDEVTNVLYEALGKIYHHEMEDDDEEAFEKAAKYLGKINIDSTNMPYTDAKKVKISIDTAQLYLAEEKFREAEIFVNRCSGLIQDGKDIPDLLKHRFWSALSQVQDANQKFHQAAAGYLRLSEQIVNEKESLEKLEQGMKCTILSPSGPNRARLLAKIYKDERSPKLPGFKLVEKMFMERLIAKSDYEVFETTLSEHQIRLTKDGWTLLQKSNYRT